MTMYGRDDQEWDRLTEVGRAFLVERARLGRPTSYTELNATMVRQTGIAGFDFERADERAAMGHLLSLIVHKDHASTGLMLSALVHYLDANDAGLGFYNLATQLGLLPRGASARVKEEFWVRQLNALHDHYSRAQGSAGDCAGRSADQGQGRWLRSQARIWSATQPASSRCRGRARGPPAEYAEAILSRVIEFHGLPDDIEAGV